MDGDPNSGLLETPAQRKARQDAEEKSTESTQRRLQLWFNAFLAFCAIVTSGAVIYQGCVMHDQLTEIRGSSNLTYHLALNAGVQAVAAGKSAEAAKTIADQAIIQARASEKSSAALVGANRAWMVPTSFSQQVAPIVVTVENAGKSPAVNLVGKAEYATNIVLEKTGYDPNAESSLRDGCAQLEHIQAKAMKPMVGEGRNMEFELVNLPQRWIKPITASYGYKILTIHGCLWYQDTLTNQKRWTEFWLQAANYRWRNKPYDKDAAITTMYIHNGNIFVFH
jgi:hypothetical protein